MRLWVILAVVAAIGMGASSYLYYTNVVVVPVAHERPKADHGDFATRFQPKFPPADRTSGANEGTETSNQQK